MKRIFLSSLLFIGMITVKAQELTLKDAVDIALKNSLDIQIARNNFEASQITNHISIAGGIPVVSASVTDNESVTNLNQKLSNGTNTRRRGAANNQLNAGLDVNFLLYNGLRVKATKNRLQAIEKQSAQLIAAQVQNVIAAVMVKYYDIIRQDGYMKTIQQSIDVTLKQKEIVDARQSVGLANNADTYQAQIDLNAIQQELQTQELVLTQAKADLMNLLTQRPDSAFAIKDTIVVDNNLDLKSVLENLTKNPELLSAAEQININGWIVKEVGAQRYPAISLNTGYNYTRSQNSAGFTLLNQNSGPFIGFGVQVPIFNGNAFKRQQKVAELDTRNAMLTRKSVEINLQTQVVKSWQAYQNNLNRLSKEQENNKLAAALLDLTLKRFELAAATIIEVREAQRSFVEAGYRLVNLSYAAKVSEIELKRLASQLGI